MQLRKLCFLERRGLYEKKYIAILLTILRILSFAGCSKKDKYEIEILVPAGSQEEFVYSEEEIALFTDTFWDDVTKVVFYDFNEDIYEVSDTGKLEELQGIFTEMTYKEIKNPWLEGTYLFDIYT